MKTIEENNRMIAEFMGWECRKINKKSSVYLIHKIKNGLPCKWLSSLTYNTSWSELMEVVEKIESLGYFVMINKWSSVYSGPESQRKNISSNFGISKIENTYKSIVQFIEWYNKNIKP